MQQERKNQSALQAASYYPQEAGRQSIMGKMEKRRKTTIRN
jgi:hypothetical protein